jgi:hypothetical protein
VFLFLAARLAGQLLRECRLDPQQCAADAAQDF